MGNKSSHFYQANRPESGGADRKDEREKTGLHERDKQQFAAKESEERDIMIPRAKSEAEIARDQQTEGEGEEKDDA